MKYDNTIGMILLLVLPVLFSCEDEPPLSTKPELRLIAVDPEQVVEYTDTLTITIQYEDGNGDLGFWEADSMSLQVHDSRLANPDWYYIPPLAPPGEEISISGTLDVRVGGLFLLGNGGAENTTFTLRMKDREGNWSNDLITPTVTILPQ